MRTDNFERLQLSEAEGETWSLYAAGDCVCRGPDSPSPIGDAVASRIGADDLSVLNLEAAIPANDSIPKTGPKKESTPNVPALLSDARFDAVTLTNNHAMDYGTDGCDASSHRGNGGGCRSLYRWTAL